MASSMKRTWVRAKQLFPGGVNSPVRAFRAVGGNPVLMVSGKGGKVKSVSGCEYIDLCLSWGALFFGHADSATVRAIERQAASGTSFGTATPMENELAEEIQSAFPEMERMRFTSSGTEAVMSAVRLCRGYTGRKKILKFEGCYHGHADSLLVKAGSGLATFGSPDSAGIPQELASLTAVLPYNDERALETFFKKNKDVACAIVEPVAANMGVVPAKRSFLSALREWTKKTGALLIFDEVITGFRLTYGGAQHVYQIQPDLTTLGKIIGGGLPIGCFGGIRGVMETLSPLGSVYQAGTLSGNPLSMVAGKSVLSRLRPPVYKKLNERSTLFADRLDWVLNRGKNKSASVAVMGSMFTVFDSEKCPADFSDVMRCNSGPFKKRFHALLASGVYGPPSAFEASFLSPAHSDEDLERVLRAHETAPKKRLSR